MPQPMTKTNFAERVRQAADALGVQKFQEPPATQPFVEMPDAGAIWRLLQVTEEVIRALRALTVERP